MKAAPNASWVIRSHSCAIQPLHRLCYIPVFGPGALALSETEANLHQSYHRTDNTNSYGYHLGCAMSCCKRRFDVTYLNDDSDL